VQISDLVPCPASGQTQAAQCQHRIGLALSKAFVEDRTTYRKTGDFFDILCKQQSGRRLWHNDDRLLASAAAAARPGGAAELADDNESLVTVMI